MQATRERILRIMKEQHQSTVDELSRELNLTAVTIRHHLEILRGEGLVASPMLQRRKAPGRPKYIYTLTDKASEYFPKRYEYLASMLLQEVRSYLSPDDVEEVVQSIGKRVASQAGLVQGDLGERLAVTVDFLNHQGYLARLEEQETDGYFLHIANCPYERVANQDADVCLIDTSLLTELLGVRPKRISWAAQGDDECCYHIRPATD